MSGTIRSDNAGFPVLIGGGADAPARPPALRPRPVGRKSPQQRGASRPRPGYIDRDRAAVELSCDVGEVAEIALAEGVSTEEVGGSIYFSEAGLELAADRRRSSRRRSPAPALTPDDARAGERLADAAKRLGMSEDELTTAALGKVAMTVRDGEVYLRSRDLKRLEGDQGLDKQAKARSAPSPLAPSSDPAADERTAAAARALGIEDRMEPDKQAEPGSGITRVKGSRERTRLGGPRRWSAR